MEIKNTVEYKSAIKYFHNHIKQIRLQLNGVLSDTYREHLFMKLNHYKLATELIERELSDEINK